MRKPIRFAPISSQATTRLRLAAAFFSRIYLAYAVFAVVALVPLSDEAAAAQGRYSVGLPRFFVMTVVGAGLFVAGRLLAKGARLGGVLAIVLVLLPIATAAAQRLTPSGMDIAIAIFTFAVVMSVWHQLT